MRHGGTSYSGKWEVNTPTSRSFAAYNNITKKVGAGKTYTFTYDTSKKTRLKSVTDNGEVQYFSYDALGNITTYKGTSSTAPSNLNWTRGNMLGSGNLSGQAFEYKYGPDNLHYSEKVGGMERSYKETRRSENLYFVSAYKLLPIQVGGVNRRLLKLSLHGGNVKKKRNIFCGKICR